MGRFPLDIYHSSSEERLLLGKRKLECTPFHLTCSISKVKIFCLVVPFETYLLGNEKFSRSGRMLWSHSSRVHPSKTGKAEIFHLPTKCKCQFSIIVTIHFLWVAMLKKWKLHMWPYCFCDYIYTTLFVGKLAFSKLNASDYGDLSDTQDEGTKKCSDRSHFSTIYE